MLKRTTLILRSKKGGAIMAGVGFCWKVVEATHNWQYIKDLFSTSVAHLMSQQIAQPPVVLLLLGLLWVMFADRRLKGERPSSQSQHRDAIAEEIRAALDTNDSILVHVEKNGENHSLTLFKGGSAEPHGMPKRPNVRRLDE